MRSSEYRKRNLDLSLFVYIYIYIYIYNQQDSLGLVHWCKFRKICLIFAPRWRYNSLCCIFRWSFLGKWIGFCNMKKLFIHSIHRLENPSKSLDGSMDLLLWPFQSSFWANTLGYATKNLVILWNKPTTVFAEPVSRIALKYHRETAATLNYSAISCYR